MSLQCKVMIGFLVTYLFLSQPVGHLYGQEPYVRWVPPVLLFDGSGKGFSSYVLVDDVFGYLHALWSYDSDGDGDGDVVFYSRGDGDSWTQPVDVLIRADGSPIQHVGAAADARGNLFAVLGQGDLVCYRVSTAEATSARNWTPMVRGPQVSVVDAKIITDQWDRLHLAYAVHGGSIYYTRLEDTQESWAKPVDVIRIGRSDAATDIVDIAIGRDRTIHIIWSENTLPKAYPPSGVYYAHSTDGGLTWSNEVELGGTYATRPQIVVEEPNTVHAVWGSSIGDLGKYHRWSADGGQTWTPLQLVERRETGLTYKEQLAVDGANNVHWVVAEDLGDLYTAWQGDSWSSLDEIELPATNLWSPMLRPFGTSLAISHGNRVNLLLRTNEEGGKRQRLWYTWRQVEAPYVLPVIPVSTPTPVVTLASTGVSTPVELPTPGSTTIPLASELGGQPITQLNPIVVSVLPAVLLIGVIVAARLIKLGSSR